ncbi:MAG: hypothetical protein QW320_08180 [Ignisphaera sp.]
MKRGLVLAGLVLTSLVVLASVATLAELGYGPGDWLRYRYSITVGGYECVYIIKVTVREVQGTVVKYDAGVEKLESGDSERCSSFGALLALAVGLSSAVSKDVSSQGPESKDIFIDPKYSGDYTTSDGVKVSYKSGVLVKMEGETTIGIVATFRVELIDTSIGWLKQGLGQALSVQQLLIVIAVVAVAAVGVATYLITRRRKAVIAPPQPRPQPQPSAPAS